jgi:hypothetical protein
MHFSTATRTAAIALCLFFACGCDAFGAADSGSVPLIASREDGTLHTYQACPAKAVKLLFPKYEAVIEFTAEPGKWNLWPNPELHDLKFARVSGADKRFSVDAVVLGDRMFVFDELLGKENSETISQLLHALHLGVTSEPEALDLAKLYLSLAYYRLADPETFLVHGDHVAATTSLEPLQIKEGDAVAETHPPQVVKRDGVYVVDLYTHDTIVVREHQVSHWQIDFVSDRVVERVSAHHDGFREPYSKVAEGKQEAAGKVRFAAAIMGDGFSDDGARTDIQDWDASDGPGYGRIHFYYGSQQKGEKRFQIYLRDAVSVVDSRPWLDDEGHEIGSQVIVIGVNGNDGTPVATAVYWDGSTVLAITSSSLSNLLEAVEWDSAKWKQ